MMLGDKVKVETGNKETLKRREDNTEVILRKGSNKEKVLKIAAAGSDEIESGMKQNIKNTTFPSHKSRLEL